jgi:hypothetical protein
MSFSPEARQFVVPPLGGSPRRLKAELQTTEARSYLINIINLVILFPSFGFFKGFPHEKRFVGPFEENFVCCTKHLPD